MTDLLPFCLRYSSRYYDVSKPFRQGEYVYATDGCVAVRVDPAGYDVTRSVLKPDMSAMPWTSEGLDWMPWPDRSRVRAGRYDVCECGSWGCEQCAGRCITYEPNAQPIGDMYIGGCYDRIIRPLPGIEWTRRKFEMHRCVAFRFDGGIGLLMTIIVDEGAV